MLPFNCGSHADYQNFVVTNLRKYYPNPDALARSTWDIIERLWNSDDDHMSPHIHPLKTKVKKPKTKGTKADSVKKVTVAKLLPELENTDFQLDAQPYASLFKIYKKEHDSHGFLLAFFRMKSFLPDFKISKVLLDSAHDAMPYYQYFKRENITPFIDLNGKGGRPPVYKNDFTIDKDGIPLCPAGCRMHRDGVEIAKGRMKFKCPKMSRKNGCISCTCETPFH